MYISSSPYEVDNSFKGNYLLCLLWENFYVTWWPDQQCWHFLQNLQKSEEAEIC